MRRREFITLVGGAAAAWPLAARAQQRGPARRIGVLFALAESDPQAQARLAVLRGELQKRGWADIELDTRYVASNDAETHQRYAKELIAL
jgi:putative ABC transport system substrate-binding protein